MRNVEALATSRWFVNGVVRVPEDQPKVSQSIKVAKIAKVDPLAYKSPMELLNQHQTIKLKGEMIDPDTVSTLHKVREFPEHGIVIYDVDDSEESRRNMREIINTHFGEDSSPWCLLQGDGEGNLTAESRRYWDQYSAYPKQVAFVNGKLNSFSANDSEEVVWWDRQDKCHDGIAIKGNVPNDELGRSGTAEFNVGTGKLGTYYNLFRGNQQNGVYERWYKNGQLRSRVTFKDGERDGLSEDWYESGQLWDRLNFKAGESDGLHEVWYENGQLLEHLNFKDGDLHGLRETWYANGQLRLRETFKNGKRDGLREEWYESGQLWDRLNFKNGEHDGLREVWYENGQQRTRENYKDGKLDGIQERWYETGQLLEHLNFKDGDLHGLYELWGRFGDIISRRFCKNSYIIAEGDEALKLAEAEKQSQLVSNKKEVRVPRKKKK